MELYWLVRCQKGFLSKVEEILMPSWITKVFHNYIVKGHELVVFRTKPIIHSTV